MRIVGIFNKKEEQIGFRLAGMETNLIHDKDELEEKLDKILDNPNIGILLVNADVFNLLPDKFEKIEKRQLPLLLKID